MDYTGDPLRFARQCFEWASAVMNYVTLLVVSSLNLVEMVWLQAVLGELVSEVLFAAL